MNAYLPVVCVRQINCTPRSQQMSIAKVRRHSATTALKWRRYSHHRRCSSADNHQRTLGTNETKKKKSLENTAPNEFTVHRLTCLHSKICHNATYAQFLCRWSKCHCPKHILAQLSFRQYQLKYVQNLGQYNVFFTNT